MVNPLLKFGTLDLTEYCAGIDFLKENTIDQKQVQGRHGVVVQSTVVAAVTVIRASGTLAEATAETLRSTLGTWHNLLGTTKKNLYAVHEDRFYRAYKRKLGLTYNPCQTLREVAWTIEWVADDPFSYVDDGAGGIDVDTTAFTLGGGDPNPKGVNHVNTGTRKAWSKITFTAGADNGQTHRMRNITTGQSYVYSGTLVNGDVVVLNFRDFTVTKNGVNDLNNWNGGVLLANAGANNFEIEGRLGSGSIETIIKTDG